MDITVKKGETRIRILHMIKQPKTLLVKLNDCWDGRRL